MKNSWFQSNTTLVYVVTVPLTARAFLTGQVDYLKSRGFDVRLISSPGAELEEFARRNEIQAYAVPIEREISLINDLRTVFHIHRLLRTIRPAIVNAGTPKAGLLGMLAARLTHVPVRIYQLRGLRLETVTGNKRSLLSMTERIASLSAHYVVCNSQSLLEQYAKLGLAPRQKLHVLGPGSSNGVDPARFLANPALLAKTNMLRQQLALPDDATVIGFVGRLTRDKGIPELIDAFLNVYAVDPKTHLVLIGDFESGDPLPMTTIEKIKQHPAIRCTGFVADTAPYYHLLDILAFPSYREGFPNAPLEAALAGAPTIGFRTTGVVDAIIDHQTGLLTPPGSVPALTDAMIILVTDPVMRRRLGEAAQHRALAEFQPIDVWRRWADFYDACLKRHS